MVDLNNPYDKEKCSVSSSFIWNTVIFPLATQTETADFLGSDLQCKAEYSVAKTRTFQKHQELYGVQKKNNLSLPIKSLKSTLCTDAFFSVRLGSKLE